MDQRQRMHKIDTMLRLRKLRLELEQGQDGTLSEEQATLLTDVCHALEIVQDSEIYYIVGESYASFIDAPAPYHLAGPAAFAVAFAQQAEIAEMSAVAAGDVALERAG